MNELKVEVTAETVTFTGKDGTRYEKQIAYAWLVNEQGQTDRHPSKIKLSVGRNGPLRPGDYLVSPASLRVGKFDALEMGWPVLVPAPIAAAAPRPAPAAARA